MGDKKKVPIEPRFRADRPAGASAACGIFAGWDRFFPWNSMTTTIRYGDLTESIAASLQYISYYHRPTKPEGTTFPPRSKGGSRFLQRPRRPTNPEQPPAHPQITTLAQPDRSHRGYRPPWISHELFGGSTVPSLHVIVSEVVPMVLVERSPAAHPAQTAVIANRAIETKDDLMINSEMMRRLTLGPPLATCVRHVRVAM
jgi:hypothetical protein